MKIVPQALSLYQLFSSQNEQFVIPAYQRRYAWGYNQTGALFDDIEYLKTGNGHLFGTVILHSGLHTGGLNRSELVDGQQRLTTISLLLAAIRNRFTDLGSNEKANDLQRLLICKDPKDRTFPKIILGDLDHEDYQKLLDPENQDSIRNVKLLNAFENFSDRLGEYNNDQLNEYFYKLMNSAQILRLDVGLAQDAYKLFETINNRGLRLTATDLIKNFLLGHAAKIDSNTLDRIKRLWADLIINLDGIDSDNFLRQYMCGLLRRKISKNKLVEEFKGYYFKTVEHSNMLREFVYFNEDDVSWEEEEGVVSQAEKEIRISEEVGNNSKMSIEAFVTKMKGASLVYKKIYLQGFSKRKINYHLSNLSRILSLPSYIFLIKFFSEDYPEKVQAEVLKVIETFMLRRHICEMRTSEHDDIFSKLMPEETDKVDSIDIVNHVKEKLMPDLPDDADFEDSFPKHFFKGRLIERAKYVLEKLEYYRTGDTGEKLVLSGTDVHLEHIIPETINTNRSRAEFGDWVDYLGDNALTMHKKYVHRIGNMTLLAGSLNIQAYNNPFAKKKGSYRRSDISITKDLAENYPNFKFYHVEKRGKELAEDALQIWKF